MLTLIESHKGKVEAHRDLEVSLLRAWRKRQARIVSFRPDSVEMPIHHNGRFWFGSRPPNRDDTTPRYWNPFGAYREKGNLRIAVEINVPIDSNKKRAKGFFARDMETGAVYLMHDGGVGGGQKGVSKHNFLWWSDARLAPIVSEQGETRLGIVVAPVKSLSTPDHIARFIQKVIDFKQATKDGETDSPQARREQGTFKDYYDEFTGKKRRRRVAEIEYISRHGDIVRALQEWRQRRTKSHEKIVKNAYVDLGVQAQGTLRELYEVKTNSDRQTLYSAIGQVFVHDESSGKCRRFLVLPSGDRIPDDVSRALKRASIGVLRFRLEANNVRILK